jgi:hypothetical protein
MKHLLVEFSSHFESGVKKRNGTERNCINGIFSETERTKRKIFEKMRNEEKRNEIQRNETETKK